VLSLHSGVYYIPQFINLCQFFPKFFHSKNYTRKISRY